MKKKAFFFALGLFSFAGIVLFIVWTWLPSAEKIKGCLTTKMYSVELCPGSKNYVPLARISPILQSTIILTEDSNFYNHHGFDWISIERNARDGWHSGSFKRGGSTITQQLAKNMFLTKDRTFIRKGLEALITDRIENTLTKKEILERYLNVVEFGKDIYGIKAAASYYFKKSPAELNTLESAFLAMVLPSPVKYSSSYHKKELTPFALKRISQIIENMYRYHRISQEAYETAIAEVGYFFQPIPPPSSDEMSLEEELDNLDFQVPDEQDSQEYDETEEVD